MASSFSDLGIELMATGENAGTWGTKTNTNLQIVEKAIAGYVEQAVTSGGTTALTITDGDATESTSVARHAVIKLTGTITGNSIVTVPDSIEKVYIVTNGTSGAYTVQFKTASGTGITFGVSEKTTRLVYSDGTNLVDAGFGGSLDLEGRELVLDADGDTTITADTDDQIDIKIAGADDFQFTANTFTAQSGSSVVVPEGGLTFGSTAITSTAAELNILDGVTSTAAELNILDGVTSTAAELNILDGVTSTAAELNLLDGITAGTVSASLAVIVDSNKDISGFRNLSITGDLTVSGDDITMGTNTAGNLLIADGTNFNSVAVGSLSEISTVANDDVFLAVDTSGGGLKKIARSAIVSGLATSGAISNIVEDTSPQLGANLDTNSHNILIDDAHFIGDENGNEQIIFQTTSSAVNQFDVTNAATGNPPQLSATGGDSNIDLNLLAKGTGHVTIVGNTNSGAIQFNCESNSHGQILKAQPHSAGVTNEMLLPDGADSTLVSLVATQTLTNKTFSDGVIASGSPTLANNMGTFGYSSPNVELKSKGATAGNLDIHTTNSSGTTARVFRATHDGHVQLMSGDTVIGKLSNSSSDFVIENDVQDKDILFKGDDNGSAITALTLDMSAAGTATFNHDVILANDSFVQFGDAGEKITGDGTDLTIASSNDVTVDAAADIQLDAAGGDVNLRNNATLFLNLSNSSNDAIIFSKISDGDLLIKGNDGGSTVTALSFDMSDAGSATFNHNVVLPNDGILQLGDAGENIVGDGTNLTISSSNSFTVDAANGVTLDGGGTACTLKAGGGTTYGQLANNSGNLIIKSGTTTAITFSGAVSSFVAANVAQEALTSSSNAVAWDASAKPNAFHVTTENTTFSAPSNNVEGAFIALEINYNGSHTIAFNTIFEFAASTAPTFTSTDGKTDILVFRYNGSVWQEVGRTLNLSES